MWTRVFCLLATVSLVYSSDLMPEDTAYEMIVEYSDYYALPKLPYEYNALEPFIDEATLQVHHKGHHRAYCKKLNDALKDWRKKVRRTTNSIAKRGGAQVLHNNGVYTACLNLS